MTDEWALETWTEKDLAKLERKSPKPDQVKKASSPSSPISHSTDEPFESTNRAASVEARNESAVRTKTPSFNHQGLQMEFPWYQGSRQGR
jgi:hypothetical protein